MILDPVLAAELESAAVLRNNVLFLSATPAIQARVGKGLERLRRDRSRQFHTEFRSYSMAVPHRHAKYPLREFAAQGRIKELPGQPGLVLIVLTAGETATFISTFEEDKEVTSTSSPAITQFNQQLANGNFRREISIPTLAYAKTGSTAVPTRFVSAGEEFSFRPTTIADPPMIRCELSHIRSTQVGTQVIAGGKGIQATELPLIIVTSERVDQLIEPGQSILVSTAISPGEDGRPVTGFMLVTPHIIDLVGGEPARPVPAPVPAQTPARSGTDGS